VDTHGEQTSYQTQAPIGVKDKTESSSNQPTIEVLVERLTPFSKDSEWHALKSSCVTRWGSKYKVLVWFTE